MSSQGQKRGNCGHAMASFDGHAFCAHREKGKGALLTRTRLIVSSAIYLPLRNMHKYVLLPTSSKKKSGKLSVWTTPTQWTIVHLWTLLVSLLLGLLVILLHLSHLHCLLKTNRRKKSPLPKLGNLLQKKWSERFSR